MTLAVRRLATVAVVWLVAITGCGRSGTTRQDEVAERGAEVMPFDLDATTHRFVPLPAGLEQIVVVDDPTDSEQVRLIREHLGAGLLHNW